MTVAPLTPPDCDLRDFGHLPLDVVKFRDSDLVALQEPEAVVAAITLWCASWHQIPAASLPDDDRVLAQLAGFGKRPSGVKEWLKVKAGALHKFVLCSDGRLYHPLVAAKARTAWEGKLKQRHRTFGATIRKHNERHPEDTINAPEFDAWIALGRPEKVADLPERNLSPGELFDYADGENVTHDTAPMSRVTEPPSHASELRDMASKGKGERKGKGKGDSKITTTAEEAPPREDLLDTVQRVTQAASVSVIQPNRLARESDIVKRWLERGIDVEETILPTIKRRLDAMDENETVSSLAYFDAAILKAHNRKPSRSTTRSAPTPLKVRDDDDERIPRIRELLRQTVGSRTYDGWLAPSAAALSLNGSTAVVTTPTPFARDWVEEHFSRPLVAATSEVAGIDVVEVRSQ